MSARQRIDPIEPRLTWDVLTAQDVERLIAARPGAPPGARLMTAKEVAA